ASKVDGSTKPTGCHDVARRVQGNSRPDACTMRIGATLHPAKLTRTGEVQNKEVLHAITPEPTAAEVRVRLDLPSHRNATTSIHDDRLGDVTAVVSPTIPFGPSIV